MGKITKRKDGRFEIKINLGYDTNGKYKRVSVFGKTQSEVKQKALKLQRKPNAQKKITFIEYANQFIALKEKFLADRTIEMYRQKVNKYCKAIHFIDMKLIDKSDIQSIINDNIEHERTCHQIKNVLSAIFESAVEDELIEKNVVKFVKVPKYKAKEKRILTKEEDFLIEHVELSDRERLYILIIKWCGLRKEETLALTRENVDFTNKTIEVNKALSWSKNTPTIKEPKSKSGFRKVPMNETLCSFMKYYISNLTTDFLFTNIRNDDPMTQQSFRRMWESIIKKLNNLADHYGMDHVDGLTSHIFRHNYASMLYELGVPPKEAQLLLGHSSYNITMDIYTHVSIDYDSIGILLSSNCRQN